MHGVTDMSIKYILQEEENATIIFLQVNL